jgi:hypothetical protein
LSHVVKHMVRCSKGRSHRYNFVSMSECCIIVLHSVNLVVSRYFACCIILLLSSALLHHKCLTLSPLLYSTSSCQPYCIIVLLRRVP